MVLKEQLDTERKRRLEIVERKSIVQREMRLDLGATISSVHRLSLNFPRKNYEPSAETRVRAQSFSNSSLTY